MEMQILTPDQIEQFLVDGYILVSDLIPEEIAARADEAAFRCNGFDPDDPDTWKVEPGMTEYFYEPELLAVYTQELLTVAAQLTSDDPYIFPAACPDNKAFVIKLLPEPGPWQVRNRHLDGSGENVYHSVHRSPWRAFALIYLHDIEPHGGGTVLFPRSHHKMRALARSQPDKYRWISQLHNEIENMDLGDHVEVEPKAGDVLFIHSLMVHCKPMNTGSRPRFALNMKW
jgi:ectoine hydroxylase-related dioxygenase (phytanoyl-CoA dioxygenase family)